MTTPMEQFDDADAQTALDEERTVTWKPVVGQPFVNFGPGARFTPDGRGGGKLTFVENRKGFRPRIRTITKQARTA